jgi:hypothetical protein
MSDIKSYIASQNIGEALVGSYPRTLTSRLKGEYAVLLINSMPTENPRMSHWLCVKQLIIALCSSGAKVIIIDVNHKDPCALLNDGGSCIIVPTQRLEGTSKQLTIQMKKTVNNDFRLEGMDINYYALTGSEHDSMSEEKSILMAADKFFELTKTAKCIFVIGGIYQPYKLEPFLKMIDTKIFYFAMNYRNDSRYKHVYSKCLSTVRNYTLSFWKKNVIRRPIYIDENTISTSKRLARETQDVLSNLKENDKILVCCGKNIIHHLKLDYLKNIFHFLRLSPDHKFLAIGISTTDLINRVYETLKISKSDILEHQLYGISFEENLKDLFYALNSFQICFLNPIHPGNGRCILLSVWCKIPTLVVGTNDCQIFCDKIEGVDLSTYKSVFDCLTRVFNSIEFKLEVTLSNSLVISEEKLYSYKLYRELWELS